MFGVIARHAASITLQCICIVFGLLAGIWLASQTFTEAVAGLLGAFFGAVITVAGAFWLMEHKANTERESLRRILLNGVQKLLDQANKATAEATTSADGARAIGLAIFNRWQFLAAFSPYRQLEHFGHIQVMAEIDACCRQFVPLLESKHEKSVTISREVGPSISQPMNMAGRNREMVAGVKTVSEEVARRCEEALKVLGGKGSHIESSNQ